MNKKYVLIASLFIANCAVAQTTQHPAVPVDIKREVPKEPSLAVPMLNRPGDFSFPDTLSNSQKAPPIFKPVQPDMGSSTGVFETWNATGTEKLPVGSAEVPELFQSNRLLQKDSGLSNNSSFEPVRTIPTRAVSGPEFRRLDSLSRLSMNGYGRLSMEREKIEEGFERIIFKNKPRFGQRIYFEGLVGLDAASGRLGQVSPALGTRVGRGGMSLGAGPNFTFDPIRSAGEAATGVRGFLKYEFPRNRFYVHAEDSGYFRTNLDAPLEGVKTSALRHVPSVGGGYVLKVREGLGLNLMMLYSLGGHAESSSPFQVRMGVSSLRQFSDNQYTKKR